MGPAQKWILIIFLLWSAVGQAERLSITAGTAAFMGEQYYGGIYNWNDHHAVFLTFGSYDIHNVDYWQYNLGYRFTSEVIEYEYFNWAPVQMGVSLIRSMGYREFFIKSPDRYPSENYYEGNALRLAFILGSGFNFFDNKLGLNYHFVVLDTGLIAIYNNPKARLPYYFSSGLSLQYNFE